MKKSCLAILGGAFIILFMAATGGEAEPQGGPTTKTIGGNSSSLLIDADFGKMPLYFVPNLGQMDEQVAFYVQGKDKAVYFTPQGITLVMAKAVEKREDFAGPNPERPITGNHGRSPAVGRTAAERWTVKLQFVESNENVRPIGEIETGAIVSCFKGKPEEWQAGIPTYSKIVYPNLWPGIDLEYTGTADRLKYEFIVQPGADPSRIRLAYNGVESVSVDEKGRLRVATPMACFYDDAPVAYQDHEGRKAAISLSYTLETQGHIYGFEVGDYDHSLPLILDPAILVYCGYLGGSANENAYAITVDGSGNVYVTGTSLSGQATFPVTVGPDLTHNGDYDAFVAKVNSSGTALTYCGYIGGSSYDGGSGIAVDGTGNAYMTGYTTSTEASFPVTVGPDLTHNGDYDAFVAKLNASGTALAYCGYIGGSSYDGGYGIAVDGTGNACITGESLSTEATFPVAAGPDLTHNGNYDAFVAKLNASGTALAYCGYIGGSSQDYAEGIALDGSGNTYVGGGTSSSEATFPVTVGPDLTYNGNTDAFVAKLNASGTALAYCGYIGGSGIESGGRIVVDGSGNAYVSGHTFSTEATFPVTTGPDLIHNGNYDVFVAKVNASGTALAYCGYIGGSSQDTGGSIAVDGSGNAYVTGCAYSDEATFPVTIGPDLTHNGAADIFVAKVNASGTRLVYCGYIGGSGVESGRGIVVDGSGNAYVSGYTLSTEATFPVNTGPDLTYNGDQDAFVAKISYWDLWEAKHAVGDFDGDGADEVAMDFGSAGIYLYDGGAWTQLSMANPESLAAADVDGDSADELLADLGSLGLWLWNAGAWNQLSGVNVEGMAAGDIDDDGTDEAVGDFGAVGMWLYDGGTWTQLSAVNADYIAITDLGAGGGDEVVGDFGTTGLWAWSAGIWTQLSGEDADYVAFGDTGGLTGDELIGDFGAMGLWLWSVGSGWSQLSAVNADFVVPVRADGDAWDEFIGDFGAAGLWSWNGGIWEQISGENAEFMVIGDVDGDAVDEGAFDFGILGLWLGSYSSGWTQLSGVDPEYLMAGDVDGDTHDEFLADFGTLGLWLWDGGAWSQISANDPD